MKTLFGLMAVAVLLVLTAGVSLAKDVETSILFECGGKVLTVNKTTYVGMGPITEKTLYDEGKAVLNHANNHSAANEKAKAKGSCKITWQWGNEAPAETLNLHRGHVDSTLRRMSNFLIKAATRVQDWEK